MRRPSSFLSALSRRTVLGLMSGAMLAATAAGAAAETVKVGIMSGEDEAVWQVVTQEAAKAGLTVETVAFSDYVQPNEALANGELQANAFQHQPYLDAQVQQHGYDIVPVGYTLVQPIGLYSRKHKSVAEIPEGGSIGIPNDPSNAGRALNLLAAQGLLKLRDGAGILATAIDVEENPKNLEIRELDAGIVGRSIDDLDAGVVNTDWALKSGIDPARERIAQEPLENNPYRNFIAVRAADKDAPWVKTLVAAYQTDAVKAALNDAYKGTTLPAW
ncbi:MetQ/NlpA family ABC transporter substrate-binding protein [Aureimonas phyllosphaerae]|uniref:Lipoprotein n=1 Tax=Aureimonas phyllosphaerae TaxID=1166078 RepID=A0A7W6FUW7_9HYPH|nr:MetQ/NlpA family ABC transporter substrate-binding protein [Aureimonas phyllosphaerae]MBB3936195.1 D-methionine transport system substrate-binding protein [Aureimonas phyllosphaerae]MBB3960080.1 D-methionine transport system substrate-binding protein [Aureimonas phyllosphaerae]SFF33060.1 D-methionine transport system substrate-binding protein [Aureimonas phyllosphaerae]